jgi:hypothetical protein
MRTSIVRLGAALLLFAAGALAQSIDLVKPGCAAPGDAVLIKGSGFGDEPTVTIGGTDAKVLRSSGEAIVCRVPSDLAEGEATIAIGTLTATLNVLTEGAPAIVHVSTGTATPGMLVFFVGARLKGATATFENGTEETTVDLKGGHRIAYLKVPADLPLGDYTVRITNGHGDSGDCSPSLSVVEAQDPNIGAIEPSEQLPGRQVVCEGTDLGPPGWCFVTWTGGDGNELFNFGFANGYDRVHTWVPWDAQAGADYDVVIDFSDGSSTGAFPYKVGTPPPPEITELQYDEGPAGSLVGIYGENLIGGGFSWPVVEFTAGDVSTEAFLYFLNGGFHGDEQESLVVEVPRGLEDGEYEVTVTVNGQKSNAVTFTVTDLPLTVTSMKPDGQGTHGPDNIVVIEGTGFGVPDFPDFSDPAGGGGGRNGLAGNGAVGHFPGVYDDFSNYFNVTVTWQLGEDEPLEGYVLWHHDREILVLPPGGWEDPLPVGDYKVTVAVDRDGETLTADAGTYTVEERDDAPGNKPGPLFPR